MTTGEATFKSLLWSATAAIFLAATAVNSFVLRDPARLDLTVWTWAVATCILLALAPVVFLAGGTPGPARTRAAILRVRSTAWPAWAAGTAACFIILRADPSQIMRMDVYFPFIWLAAHGVGLLTASRFSPSCSAAGWICFLSALIYGVFVFHLPWLHQNLVYFTGATLAAAHAAGAWRCWTRGPATEETTSLSAHL